MVKSILGFDDLIKTISEETGKSQKEVKEFYETLVKVTKDNVAKLGDEKEKFVLKDIATFTKRDRAERNGRNPKTKEAIVIPASTVVVATADKKIKNTFK